MEANYRYCQETTADYPLSKQFPNCIVDFNGLIKLEGYSGNVAFSKSEVVLDMDAVEKCFASKEERQLNKSMDSAFCIINGESKKIVLVEYKFNHADFTGLSKDSMEGKVAGTSSLLGDSMPIYYRYFFVVKQELINEAYSRFFRMFPALDRKYTAICIDSLKETFFKEPIN